MSYGIKIKSRSATLRQNGASIKEIAAQLGISVATSSLWCKPVKLNQHAKLLLETKKRQSLILANSILNEKRILSYKSVQRKMKGDLQSISITPQICRLLCGIFIRTEGGKSEKYRVSFTNSDPKMIQTFLTLFRRGFSLDESKFRGLLHIHDYHNEGDLLQFWSSITRIPTKQFTKSYRKPHTGIRIREGYKGSIHITYYDSKVAHLLRALYNMFADTLGAW